MSLGEFDVSLEEIEEPPVSHIEGDPFTDAPQAVTDIPSSIQAVEEIEEIEDLDEVDALLKDMVVPEPDAHAASPAPWAASVPEAPPPSVPLAAVAPEAPPPLAPLAAVVREASPSPPAVPEPSRPPVPAHPPLEATSPAGADRVFREQFAARANEIFEKVAAETLEKVLWEGMDRFSAEFSAKIREYVEAVAWEVIPSTAEALIREEISRIREQTEKKSR
jgi:hypothetical protein